MVDFLSIGHLEGSGRPLVPVVRVSHPPAIQDCTLQPQSSVVSEVVRKKIFKFSEFALTHVPNILTDDSIKKVSIFTTLFFQKPLQFGSVSHFLRGELK